MPKFDHFLFQDDGTAIDNGLRVMSEEKSIDVRFVTRDGKCMIRRPKQKVKQSVEEPPVVLPSTKRFKSDRRTSGRRTFNQPIQSDESEDEELRFSDRKVTAKILFERPKPIPNWDCFPSMDSNESRYS